MRSNKMINKKILLLKFRNISDNELYYETCCNKLNLRFLNNLMEFDDVLNVREIAITNFI